MENMSWNDALAKYRLNFDVEKIPLQYIDPTGIITQAPNLYGMQRSDTRELLPSVAVGKSYQIIQNSSYADIGNRITEGLNAEFVSGGTLRNGSIMFLQAKLPGFIRVKGSDDVTEKYITFMNSFDTTISFKGMLTGLRLFCANQIARLIAEARRNAISVKHTKNAQDRLRQADAMILEAHNAFKVFQEKVDWLAEQPISDAQVTQVAREMFGVKKDTVEADIPTRTKNNIAKVLEVFQTADDLKMWHGTGWAAHNAISAFHTHHSSLRSTTSRVESNLVGTGANSMQRGFGALDRVLGASV